MNSHDDSLSRDSHARWREQLPGYLLGALDPAERADLEEHLKGCGECTAELRWLRPAAEAVPTDVEPAEPPEGLKRSVMAGIEADLAADAVPAADTEMAERSEERASRVGTRSRREWLSWFRPVTLGAIATVLIGGLVIGYVIRGGGEPPPAGPGVTVTRTGTTPGTTAELVRRGNSGTLTVANLKQPPAGKVYQAWIRRGTEIEATDSLFTPGRDGTATTAIGDLRNVNAVMVTAEPAGGSKRPTAEPFIILPTAS